MKRNTPGPAEAGAEGEEYEAADPAHILPLNENINVPDLACADRFPSYLIPLDGGRP